MKHKLRFYTLLFVSIVAIVMVFAYVYRWEHREARLEVNFFSLKRGRAIFVRTPANKTILVGGGQSSEVIREITKATPFYSRKIDYVFIPSATPAQIGGLIEVIDRYEVGEVFIPELIATSTVLEKLMRKVINKKIHVSHLGKGDELQLGGVDIKILFPIKDFKYNKTSLPELGMEVVYKDTRLFLMGNLSKTTQKKITETMKIEESENLVEFYHSASKAKVSAELLEKTNPKYVFSTKEKSTRWVSDGFSWDKI